MNHIDRILCAFSHKEPDRVPTGEFVIDRNLIPLLAGESSDDLFEDTKTVLATLDVDLAGVEATVSRSPSTELVGVNASGRSIVQDSWGAVYLQSDIGTLPASLLESPIKVPDDVYGYGMPPLSAFDRAVDEVKKWVEATDYFVFATIWSPFSSGLTELMGWENYMIWTITHRKELEYISTEYAAYQAEVAKRYLAAGAHGILIAGDLAGNDGPFLHPGLIQELVFPRIKTEVDIIKAERKVPVVYHSDGNINSLMDGVIETGIDGLNPLEPHAGMDLATIKKRYGGRLCLLGNVDTNRLLPRGTPEQVAAEVRRIIDVGFPGGGFILQTANMLTPDIPVQNVWAMFEAARAYGRP